MSNSIESLPIDDGPPVRWKGKIGKSKPRLLLLVTEDWYFRSHRLDLARAARDAGMQVSIVTLAEDNGKWITDEGFKYIPIPFVKGGRNPLRELFAVIQLVRLYRRERPDIVHHVAMKPILYGSWAARLTKVPAVVNAFGGLGFVFVAKTSYLMRLMRIGIKAALRFSLGFPNSRVILQITENRDRLVRETIVRRDRTVIIRGVGVDLTTFTPQPEVSGVPVVILASRMLWDKGIGDFVQAARLLKKERIEARCVLVGRLDPGSPTSISEDQLVSWQREGVVEWWGHREDMPAVLGGAHIVVLPTFYGEGIPKILLEACACAKPVVTTPLSGCTEIVRDGDNGFLAPQKDPVALATAIGTLLAKPGLRKRMGMRGREIVVREFSAQQVAEQTLAVYAELLEHSSHKQETSCKRDLGAPRLKARVSGPYR
jgi:glycosyltransferase involved in cell wall biosynthesis